MSGRSFVFILGENYYVLVQTPRIAATPTKPPTKAVFFQVEGSSTSLVVCNGYIQFQAHHRSFAHVLVMPSKFRWYQLVLVLRSMRYYTPVKSSTASSTKCASGTYRPTSIRADSGKACATPSSPPAQRVPAWGVSTAILVWTR
jgi:hypothetical protein